MNVMDFIKKATTYNRQLGKKREQAACTASTQLLLPLAALTRLCFAFAAVAVYVVWEKAKEGNVLAPGANGDIWNWRPLKQVHRACRVVCSTRT